MSATSATSKALACGATADELFTAAFSLPRDPRSPAYKQGVLAALKFRIEGRRIPKLYDPATAEDDAYYAGQAEGHAIWRRVQAESAGAAIEKAAARAPTQRPAPQAVGMSMDVGAADPGVVLKVHDPVTCAADLDGQLDYLQRIVEKVLEAQRTCGEWRMGL